MLSKLQKIHMATWLISLIILALGSIDTVEAARLANQNKRGLRISSIEEVLQLNDRDIDLGTAALILSEQWSEVVHGLRYRAQLDEMAQEILARLKEQGLRPNFRAIPVINHYLFEELGFRAVTNADNPDDLFLHSVLDNRKGYCLSLSVLYLSLAERIGLPLHGVVVPGHFFVRYDSRTKRFNIETTAQGANPTNEYYESKHSSPDERVNGLYMGNLSNLQTLGCLFNNFGVVYLETGQYEAALFHLDLAVRINPMLSESKANMGNIYLRQGRFEEAIGMFKSALDINPSDPKTHYNLGHTYAQAQRFSQAESHLQETLELDPEFIDAYVQLAATYALQKKFQRARQLLNRAISDHGQNAELHCQLGNVYVQMGYHNRALKPFKKAVALQADHIQSLFGLGLCYRELGLADLEMGTYDQVLAFKPDMFEAIVRKGDAYFNRQDYRQAIEKYNQAILLNDAGPWLFENLGKAYSEIHDVEQATLCFKKALDMDPNLGYSHYILAITYYNQQEFNAAWEHMEKARALNVKIPKEQIDQIAAQAGVKPSRQR
jgi:tetratricopeptide (TPR) repeat protein